MVTKTIRTTEDFWKRLKVYCAEKSIKISDFIKDTLEPIIIKRDPKINLMFTDKEEIHWEDLRTNGN